MQKRNFGPTGLEVTPLGFGAMHLNDDRVTEAEAGRLLNAVLDLGVNLIDTARGYGLSEARIGRHLAHRRQDFVLSTKVGYGIPGVPDWTGPCILAGVDAALARMRCERLDIVHLHSCPLSVLARGEVTEALAACARAGKVGVVAYSGENAELDFALASGAFGSVQASFSICDQANFARLPALARLGLGVLAKRPLAGAVWRAPARPGTPAEGQYWDRLRAMDLAARLPALPDLALRFAAFAPGVASALVGTASLDHFKANLTQVELGPLTSEENEIIRGAFLRLGGNWEGMI
jgi:aryl-alcohol dehydrogenase-like predicted oxidoreductase